MNPKYAKIINHKRRYSASHPVMSNAKRAAQFAPFAALNTFEDTTNETARQTQEKIIISENEIAEIDRKLRFAQSKSENRPEIKITYFKCDKHKSGGKYLTATGFITDIDMLNSFIVLSDETAIPINDIIAVDGEIFAEYD